MHCECDPQKQTLAFIVVTADLQATLGETVCVRLKMVRRVYIDDTKKDTNYDELMAEYNDLLQGLHCLPGEHTARVDKCVQFVIHSCSKVPFTLQNL